MHENILLYNVVNSIIEIIKGLNVICLKFIGVGLLPIIVASLFVDLLLYYMGIKRNSILGRIIPSIIQEPLENIFDFTHNK